MDGKYERARGNEMGCPQIARIGDWEIQKQLVFWLYGLKGNIFPLERELRKSLQKTYQIALTYYRFLNNAYAYNLKFDESAPETRHKVGYFWISEDDSMVQSIHQIFEFKS